MTPTNRTHKSRAWAEQTIRALRAMDLLPDWRNLPLNVCVEKAVDEVGKYYTHAAREDRWRAEAYLVHAASRTEGRVWWVDCEWDPRPDYTQALIQLAGISRGAFQPIEIEEHWTGHRHVQIIFSLEDLVNEMNPTVDDHWLDTTIIDSLNLILQAEESPISYSILDREDQTAMVFALTDEEKQQLLERGWIFESPEERQSYIGQTSGGSINWDDVFERAHQQIAQSIRLNGNFLTIGAQAELPERSWISPMRLPKVPGPEFYKKALNDWAHLTDGLFQPTRISARRDASNQIVLRFTHDGQTHELHPAEFGSHVFDATLVYQLNPILAASGRSFAVDEIREDSMVFVGFTTEAERRALTRDRSIQFETCESLKSKLNQHAGISATPHTERCRDLQIE